VEVILARHPDVAAALVFAVPDPRTGDQVMAALELKHDAVFDAVAFADFLESQPDVGTKWAPTYIRVVDTLPVTGTGKVERKALRADRWQTQDPVWWRKGRSGAYERLTNGDIEQIHAEFESAGRRHLLS
jgi:fatty-acyl-CoA synthase